MSRARIVILILLVLGTVAGVIGGLLLGDFWFRTGIAIFLAGVLILYAVVIWKRPEAALDVEADPISQEERHLNIPEAERLLSAKDRGTIPGHQ